jgi:hypothetical protein
MYLCVRVCVCVCACVCSCLCVCVCVCVCTHSHKHLPLSHSLLSFSLLSSLSPQHTHYQAQSRTLSRLSSALDESPSKLRARGGGGVRRFSRREGRGQGDGGDGCSAGEGAVTVGGAIDLTYKTNKKGRVPLKVLQVFFLHLGQCVASNVRFCWFCAFLSFFHFRFCMSKSVPKNNANARVPRRRDSLYKFD